LARVRSRLANTFEAAGSAVVGPLAAGQDAKRTRTTCCGRLRADVLPLIGGCAGGRGDGGAPAGHGQAHRGARRCGHRQTLPPDVRPDTALWGGAQPHSAQPGGRRAAVRRAPVDAARKTMPAWTCARCPSCCARSRCTPGSPATRLAIKLMALTFVRTGELIGARWAEFDLAGGRVAPACRAHEDAHPSHRPAGAPGAGSAAPAAVHQRWAASCCFRASATTKKPMSNMTILAALVPHGVPGAHDGARLSRHRLNGAARGWVRPQDSSSCSLPTASATKCPRRTTMQRTWRRGAR
jgi:hypothetical protein